MTDPLLDPRVQAAWTSVITALSDYERTVAAVMAEPPPDARVAELEAELERWKLRYIEATNPGIDMNEVRRVRPQVKS
jgi:hypothetical protein